MATSDPYVDDLSGAFRLDLKSRNRSPRTIENYLSTVDAFTRWCAANEHPTDPRRQRPSDVKAWVAHQLDQGAADSSVVLRFRCLQQWFRFLVEDDELEASPMAKLSAPNEAERPVPVFSDDELRALVGACAGREWIDRRDLALIRLLIDTGMRLGELAGLSLADLDVAGGTLLVRHAKGGRMRVVGFGDKTARALDRYLRARRAYLGLRAVSARAQGLGEPEGLWLGVRGPLSDAGIAAALKHRADLAGVAGMHAHRFRHTAAHRWLSMGGQEQDLMKIAGWRSRQMLARYGASAAEERAREAHRRIRPGDSI